MKEKCHHIIPVHILQIFALSDNDKEINRSDSLSILRDIFPILRDSSTKYYNSSEYSAIGEIILLFKKMIIFEHCNKKHQ